MLKRTKPSLSIVNPLDVLRQRLLLEIARRQMRENSRQVNKSVVVGYISEFLDETPRVVNSKLSQTRIYGHFSGAEEFVWSFRIWGGSTTITQHRLRRQTFPLQMQRKPKNFRHQNDRKNKASNLWLVFRGVGGHKGHLFLRIRTTAITCVCPQASFTGKLVQ